MLKLSKISLSGFKSISSDTAPQSVVFGDINVVIGANGSGKSNLVSFFKMLNMMMAGALQEYVGKQGSSNSLLYYGFKKTENIKAQLCFTDGLITDNYGFTLTHAGGDTLIFTDESISHHKSVEKYYVEKSLGAGHSESKLSQKDIAGETQKNIGSILRSCKVFQFHDTSINSKIRNNVHIGNNHFLYDDGGNLAAYLYALARNDDSVKYYDRIIRRIREIMPQFDEFVLEPKLLNAQYISLDWKEKGNSEYVLGPHQLSDGSLRFMALATVLLQPNPPAVIIIDEPELGLHPAAISSLAAMVREAAVKSQVILSTQSPRLVDEFDVNQIIVAERDIQQNCSIFKRLNADKLGQWLEAYSLSELWEKNVLGGKP